MKKILYIGNFSFPDGNAAGARVLGNGYLLRELGYEVFYIGLDNRLYPNSILEDTKQLYNDFLYYNLPYPNGITGWLNYKKKFKEVTALIKDEDLFAVIIYGSPTISFFGKLIRNWCRKKKIKFITDCVDWLPAGAGGLFFRFAKFFDTTYQKRILNSSADGAITVSSFLSNYYKAKGLKTAIIPPLVNPGKFDNLSKILNSDDVVELIYVGQPFPLDVKVVKEASYKDRLDKVISVLHQLKELNFVFCIYGLTKEQYLSVIPKHKDLLAQIENKIQFYGYIDNSLVIRKIASADFTILFRDFNKATQAGFPTKFVESISCGTPVITTRTSDLERYLIEGENGFFVDTENQKKLISKMKKILKLDKKMIKKMKEKCYKSRLFFFNNYKKEMITLFDSIKKK